MKAWAIYTAADRLVRYTDQEWEAEMWATAIGGTYREVDLGGPEWTNDYQADL